MTPEAIVNFGSFRLVYFSLLLDLKRDLVANLDLVGSNLGDEGAMHVAKALAEKKSLMTLGPWAGGRIGGRGKSSGKSVSASRAGCDARATHLLGLYPRLFTSCPSSFFALGRKKSQSDACAWTTTHKKDL